MKRMCWWHLDDAYGLLGFRNYHRMLKFLDTTVDQRYTRQPNLLKVALLRAFGMGPPQTSQEMLDGS